MITTILAAVFVLGILIFVHELGHFLVAKRVGIRVERFSLGFPPKMIGKKIGDTEYCISWIPLGGYVKMAGEVPDEEHVTGAPDEFMSKTRAQRAAVVFAGPFANIVTAIVIGWAMISIQGIPTTDPDNVVVGAVMSGGPADELGLQQGDIILSVNDTPVESFQEMASQIHDLPGDSVYMTWERDGKTMSSWTVAEDTVVLNVQGEEVRQGRIGIGQDWEYVKKGVFASAWLAVEQTWAMGTAIIKFLWQLITFQISLKMIGGPVFIAKMAGDAARAGVASLMYLVVFLSVNLAIVNLLPIPVLDGGHLLFLGIEKVRGKSLSLKQRAIAQQIGLIFLLAFITLITYQDILR